MGTATQTAMAIGALGLSSILIGSAVFGAVSIAKPLTQDGWRAGRSHERPSDQVPYATRSDEVGEIAKATEVFKDSIARKGDQSSGPRRRSTWSGRT